jgi:hypothetical protein
MKALLALALLQGSLTVTPERPTVGDTVWIAWTVAAPPGWRVRPGALTSDATLASLGDPIATRTADGWVVRYPVALWTPGAVTIPLPALWRSGPDGSVDSLPGPVASLTVASVLPDTGRPLPRPALAPLRQSRPVAWPVALAAALALGVLAGGVAWRRRGPARAAPPAEAAASTAVADARWLAAGEPKAVAARAAARLRQAIGRVDANAVSRDAVTLLAQLERVEFAAAQGEDTAELSRRATRLAREMGA